MSLCTWATVVSTVPSLTVHGVETQQISREPVPLPTFLSFLELLEELNREESGIHAEKEKLPSQETLTSSSPSFKDLVLDEFLDLDGLGNEDIFKESSTLCSTANWTSFSDLDAPDYVFPSLEVPYKHEDLDFAMKFDKSFCDWSPELFEEDDMETQTQTPLKTPLQKAETQKEDSCSERVSKPKPHSLAPEAVEEPVKRKRKRKCANSFQRQESRSSWQVKSTHFALI